MVESVMLYITVSNREEGLEIGRTLVEEGMCACANVIGGLTSIFRWEGEVQTDNEAVLIAKTRRDLVEAATDLVLLEHSYDCPCIVALPIVGGNPAFLNWIGEETEEAVS